MTVKQVSVFLENKIGRLAEVTQVMGQHGVNIRALAIADTSEFGILRLIVTQPDVVRSILEEAGFTVSETEVIAVEVPDEPGGLASILAGLRSSGINVEYVYAFAAPRGQNAVVVLKVEDTGPAVAYLSDHQIRMLRPADIGAL